MDYLQYGRKVTIYLKKRELGFKPCYKWITFNTGIVCAYLLTRLEVLNLVINGLPSIPKVTPDKPFVPVSFKPCYKWITFNT